MTKLAHSYSALKLYTQCPKRYWYQRVARSVTDPGSAAADYGERVHKALELYIQHKADLPPELESIRDVVDRVRRTRGVVAEREIALTADWKPTSWFADDAWLRAKLDVSAVGSDAAVVLDWKTGKRVVDTDQLELFALAIMTLHQNVQRVYTAFVWIRDRAIDSDYYLRSGIDDMRDRLLHKISRVEISLEQDRWPARPSRLCRWCPARHLCPDAE